MSERKKIPRTDMDMAEGKTTVPEKALFHALERAPAIAVPATFAVRVAQLAVAQRPAVRSRWTGFGLRAAAGSAVLLPFAMFAFAPHAIPSFLNLRFDLEMTLLVELGGVGYLLTRVGLRD